MKIEMHGISKGFYGVEVLKEVNFSLKDAQIHALMGENGAGKSTLLKILTGVYTKDNGVVKVNGEEKVYAHPKQAEEEGIVFIYQELNILKNISVVENLFLGRELRNKFGVLDKKTMREKASQVFERLGMEFDLDQPAGEYSIGKQQMMEIAKALLVDAKVIIMDEPTAALTDQEISKLFSVIRELKQEGVSFIYISHRLEEIFALCDEITILRDGKDVFTSEIPSTNFDEVVRHMVGREIGDRFPKLNNKPGDKVLELVDLTAKGKFKDVSFHLNKGEILGVAGLMGSGRTEVLHAIFGNLKPEKGQILLNGESVKIKSPIDAKKRGMAFITEDRKGQGLILDFTIEENIFLVDAPNYGKYGVIDKKEVSKRVEELIELLHIKCYGGSQTVKSLSGGNQQKVVFAKWLQTKPDILLLDEPTRGVDVGAKKEIYNIILDLANEGVSIILVSSELPEVISLSNRIVVMHEGRVGGIVTAEEATQEKIMQIATGGQ